LITIKMKNEKEKERMRKFVKKMVKKVVTIGAVAAMVLSMAGCSSGSGDQKTGSTDAASTSGDAKKKVVVSMDGATAPFNYYDDNGQLVGYEVDLLNEIAKRAGDIEFEFNVVEWSGIFASMDSGKADMTVNNITKKPEREEKYLFSDDYYFVNHTVIVTQKGNTTINSIKDLEGKSIESEAGVAVTLYLEDYNKNIAKTPIDIVYSEAGISSIVQNVYNGRYEACIYAQVYIDEVVKNLGIEVDCKSIENEDDIQSSEAWFVYRKDNTELKSEIDGILKEIIDDGTAAKLCEKWMGKDYTK